MTAPSLGDSVTTTLAFTGVMPGGNASQTVSQTVVIDTVAPASGVIPTLSQGVVTATTPSLLGYGTVTDGGGVVDVQVVFIVRPDGSTAVAPATLSRAAGAAALSSTSWSAAVCLRPDRGLPGAGGRHGCGRQSGGAVCWPHECRQPPGCGPGRLQRREQGEAILVSWETAQ